MHTSLFHILIFLFISADLFGQARTTTIGTGASVQRNIFVSPSGDDHNTGLTINDPLKTIAAGLAAVLAGDTMYVLPGTYAEPIKFVWTSMHHGDLVYYNGSLIDIRGTSGSIVIRNNTITNAFNGIRFTAQEFYDTNVEISGNSVSNIRDNDFEPENYTYNLYIHHNSSHNIHKTMSVDNVAGG